MYFCAFHSVLLLGDTLLQFCVYLVVDACDCDFVVGKVAVPYIALIDGVTMGGVSDSLCSAVSQLA